MTFIVKIIPFDPKFAGMASGVTPSWMPLLVSLCTLPACSSCPPGGLSPLLDTEIFMDYIRCNFLAYLASTLSVGAQHSARHTVGVH